MARMLFADTFYWVAMLNPGDALHARVMGFVGGLGKAHFVTTDEILTEVLNWFSRGGRHWRNEAVLLVQDLRNDPDVDVLPQTRADFDAAGAARPDKAYSLTDCRSTVAMRGQGITEVLTNDHHFTQEGFTILFP